MTPQWSLDAAGKTWPIESYADEGPRSTDWLTRGVIKQHRTLGTYVNMLIAAGFAIVHLEEWAPTPEQVAAAPELADERRRAMFFLMAVQR